MPLELECDVENWAYIGVAGEAGLCRDLAMEMEGASRLSSLPEESIRRGGGLVGADGCCRVESSEGLEAPGIGEKLPGTRV